MIRDKIDMYSIIGSKLNNAHGRHFAVYPDIKLDCPLQFYAHLVANADLGKETPLQASPHTHVQTKGCSHITGLQTKTQLTKGYPESAQRKDARWGYNADCLFAQSTLINFFRTLFLFRRPHLLVHSLLSPSPSFSFVWVANTKT